MRLPVFEEAHSLLIGATTGAHPLFFFRQLVILQNCNHPGMRPHNIPESEKSWSFENEKQIRVRRTKAERAAVKL